MNKLIKSLILQFSFVFFLMIVSAGVSFAQTFSPVSVKIVADKASYAVSEPVIMTITAVNDSDKDARLTFSSSNQTDYIIDGKFRWSGDKFFPSVITEVTIPPRGKKSWTVTHKNSDYVLIAGTHTIVGEVVGYGSASTKITVATAQDTTPPETIITSESKDEQTGRDAVFTFSGTDNLSDTNNLTYVTYLQGYDNGWSSFSSQILKTYTNLPNGAYTFFVKARDEAGNIDPIPASATFSIDAIQNLSFSVLTDKFSYTQGENVIVTVGVKNNSPQSTILNFPSSYQTDYIIDGKFRWSGDKDFTQALTSVTLNPLGTKEWSFTHTPAQYGLPVGIHTVKGEVVGYGNSATTFSIVPTQPSEYFESFESDLGGWQQDHHIDCEQEVFPCTFQWSIERSADRAQHGIYSLKGFLNGQNDDGTIWMEKTFPVSRNSAVTINLSFQLWSQSASELNKWPVVAYIGTSNPEQETDFTIVGQTDDVAGWKKYTYSRTINTEQSDFLWIAFGFGAIWEISRTYFMDSVSIGMDSSPNPHVSAQPKFTALVTSTDVQVQANALNIRQDASPGAFKIGLVRKGETLKKLEEKNGWIKVELSSGQKGWVFGQYVASTTTDITLNQEVTVTARVLNVRSGPGVNSKIITTLQRNSILKKLEEKNGWIRVSLTNGQSGWVSGKFVK